MATYKATETVTARPSSTSLLTIDSQDRFPNYTVSRSLVQSKANQSPYNFTINKNESLMTGFFTRLAVTEVVFPFVTPNVNQKSSTIGVKYQVGAGPIISFNIALAVGFYTPSQLATAMQVAVRAGSGGNLSAFTMTYGTAPSGASQPIFDYKTNASGTKVAFVPNLYNTPSYPYPASTRQLFDVLGFDISDGTGSGNDSLFEEANSLWTFAQWTRFIDIVSPQLTYNQPLKDQSTQPIVRDALCRVYLDQVSGAFNANKVQASDATFAPTGTVPFVIYHNFTHPKQINWTPNQPVGQLTFQVYDDQGFPLTEVYNYVQALASDWSMTLQVSEN
jgi:hypothetical protein